MAREHSSIDLSRAKSSAIGTALLTAWLWLLEAIDTVTGHMIDRVASLHTRDLGDLWAIFTAPFGHYGWAHLVANTSLIIPLAFLLGLGGARIVVPTTLIVTIVSGLTAWLISAPHTATQGASGVVFGWLMFLIVRGFFTRDWRELVLGLLLGALYGYVLWGVLPGEAGVSWQGHLGGAAGGLLAAFLLRKRLKPKPKPVWQR